MTREFLPNNEPSRAHLNLLTLNMRDALDKHVEEFTDLIETCDTPTKEAYYFLLMSLPQYLKGKIAEEFPESDPATMKDVYKCARKHEIAEN